jgi:putative ABC transport system permease protein
MGIPLRRGRVFERGDRAGAPRVAVVNEALARRFFPGEDPIGQRVRVDPASQDWLEIVGVVGDVKHGRLDLEAPPQTYESLAQRPRDTVMFVVRGAITAAAARAAIAAADPEQAIGALRPLGDLVAESVARQRFALLLFAAFSAVALVLAVVGIYGVMAYTVAQRTGEIGIRMALGARSGAVLRLVALQGGRLVALGLGAGVLGALLLTRFLGTLLFGVTAHDPATFAAIAGLLAAGAGLACLLPALRATKVDPMIALRTE